MSLSHTENSYTVEFAGVGRDQRRWKATFPKRPTLTEIQRAVKKAKVLASKNFECIFDSDEEYGEILVGGYRPVGAFRVTSNRSDEERPK